MSSPLIRCVSAVFLVLVLLPGNLSAQQAGGNAPPELAQWRDWVLWDKPWIDCPRLEGQGTAEAAGRQCAWFEPLQVTANADGGSFTVGVQTMVDGWVALPGGSNLRPENVTRNGTPQAVVSREGHPQIWLEAGNHQLAGRWSWRRMPQYLQIPQSYALVRLERLGQVLSHPRMESQRLLLSEAAPVRDESEPDQQQIIVSRKLLDDRPTVVVSIIEVNVSGAPRSIDIPGAILPGFEPFLMEQSRSGTSAWPARLTSDGTLVVQAGSGSNYFTLLGKSDQVLDQLAFPASSPASSGQEVWAFQQLSGHRVAAASGAPQVDARQVPLAGNASQWSNLPLFLMQQDSVLAIEERSRGMDPSNGNQLKLQRHWWLDFDGRQLHALDRIEGQMRHGWRYAMNEPFQLQRAEGQPGHDERLLLTRLAADEPVGFEARDPSPDYLAWSAIDRQLSLPANGWNLPMQSLEAQLHLPPGWRLVVAPGIDRAVGSWWDQWRLLDLFLLLLTVALTRLLLGNGAAVLAAVLLLIGFHELNGLVAGWLLLVALILALRALPKGRFHRLVLLVCSISGAVLVIGALMFAASQARQAIYPQLSQPLYGGQEHQANSRALFDSYGYSGIAQSSLAPAPVPMAKRSSQQRSIRNEDSMPADPMAEAEELDRVQVTGSRINRSVMINQMPEGARVQSGVGEPRWTGRSHALQWQGPVSTGQRFQLWLLPPWLDGLLRLASIALLAWLLWRVAVQLKHHASPPAAGAGAARGPARRLPWLAALLACMTTVPVISQAEIPEQELLRQYAARLLQPPPCASDCASLASALVVVQGDRLTVEMEWHAADPIAVPLPWADEQAWQVERVTLDGQPAALSGRDASLLRLNAGIQRLRMDGHLAGGNELGLQFPERPARIVVAATGWQVAGVSEEGRLVGEQLRLSRTAAPAQPDNSDVDNTVPTGDNNQTLHPLARVERTFFIDREWHISTRASAWIRNQGAMAIAVPLVAGEQPLRDLQLDEQGRASVLLQSGAHDVNWPSRLQISDSISITAPDQFNDYVETWLFQVSPIWHVSFNGVPQAMPSEDDNFWQFSYLPHPGETLTVTVSRPLAEPGPVLAVDELRLVESQGRQLRSSHLEADLRATLGTTHRLQLPEGARLVEMLVNGQPRFQQLDEQGLELELAPGTTSLQLRWEQDIGSAVRYRGDHIDLGAPTANITRSVKLPGERWVLAAWGPGVGPAVLYWSLLLVILVAAWGLAKSGLTPIRLHHWILLGIGFSLFNWPVLILVSGWLLLIGWVDRKPPPKTGFYFNLRQMFLVALSVITLLVLVSAIPYSLLTEPDMQIAGMGSHGGQLNWFLDRSNGEVNPVTVLSLPNWAYQLAILAWALWLSLSLIRWVRWAFNAVSQHGWWRHREKVTQKPGTKDA